MSKPSSLPLPFRCIHIHGEKDRGHIAGFQYRRGPSGIVPRGAAVGRRPMASEDAPTGCISCKRILGKHAHAHILSFLKRERKKNKSKTLRLAKLHYRQFHSPQIHTRTRNSTIYITNDLKRHSRVASSCARCEPRASSPSRSRGCPSSTGECPSSLDPHPLLRRSSSPSLAPFLLIHVLLMTASPAPRHLSRGILSSSLASCLSRRPCRSPSSREAYSMYSALLKSKEMKRCVCVCG